MAQQGKQFASATVANQLLIQVVALAYPDLFYDGSTPKSPAEILFNTFELTLGNPVTVNTLLWICAQQSIISGSARFAHPSGIEYWFRYLYPCIEKGTVSASIQHMAIQFAQGSLVR